MPFGNLNENWVVYSFRFVILLHFLPQPVDLNPDNRIGLRIVILAPIENFHANRVFLDFRVSIRDRFGD